jgi:DNA-binding response OmpR family regulator
MARVLIVDDEEGVRQVLVDALSTEHDTADAPDAAAALGLLEDEPWDILLSDLRMPGRLDGMDLVRLARARWPEMQVIVLTAHGSIDGAVEAMKLGAFDFLEKPVASPDALRALVRRALNWRGRSPLGNAGGALADAAGAAGTLAGARTVAAAANGPPGQIANFLWQLRRRRVYTVAVGYAAVAFLGLQAAELILPGLPMLPGWLYSALVGLALAGFPVALVLGWVFDVTAKGVRRTTAHD